MDDSTQTTVSDPASAPLVPTTPPVILLAGFWLGGWAWAAVAGQLRSAGLAVSAVTLPGLEAAATDRGDVRFIDHVDAVIEQFPAEGQVVLVAHSGAGAVASGVLDRMPERVARVIYVDSGPVGDGEIQRPNQPGGTDLALPTWQDFRAQMPNMLDGLSAEQLDEFRVRAVPQPNGVVTDRISLTDPARNDVPATVICCTFPSAAIAQAADDPMFAPLQELTDVSYLDLPTGHWPMWSEPEKLGELIAVAARG